MHVNFTDNSSQLKKTYNKYTKNYVILWYTEELF